jgi:hypothetical protein
MIVWSLDNRFVLAAIMGRYLFLFFFLGFLGHKWTKSIIPFLSQKVMSGPVANTP